MGEDIVAVPVGTAVAGTAADGLQPAIPANSKRIATHRHMEFVFGKQKYGIIIVNI
jgi:hypothetical protein